MIIATAPGHLQHGLGGVDAGNPASVEKPRMAMLNSGFDLRGTDAEIEQMLRPAGRQHIREQ